MIISSISWHLQLLYDHQHQSVHTFFRTACWIALLYFSFYLHDFNTITTRSRHWITSFILRIRESNHVSFIHLTKSRESSHFIHSLYEIEEAQYEEILSRDVINHLSFREFLFRLSRQTRYLAHYLYDSIINISSFLARQKTKEERK